MDKIKALEIENGSFVAQVSNQNSLITQLKIEIENLLKQNKSHEKTNRTLEQQTTILGKNLQKKTNECENLQKSLNAQNVEISKLGEDLNKGVKGLKVKEKEIYESAKKYGDLDETCKRRKEDLSKLKKENKELEKKLKHLNKVKKTVTVATDTHCLSFITKPMISSSTSTMSNPLESKSPPHIAMNVSSSNTSTETANVSPNLPFIHH